LKFSRASASVSPADTHPGNSGLQIAQSPVCRRVAMGRY
jgi:hypothetical protein